MSAETPRTDAAIDQLMRHHFAQVIRGQAAQDAAKEASDPHRPLNRADRRRMTGRNKRGTGR